MPVFSAVIFYFLLLLFLTTAAHPRFPRRRRYPKTYVARPPHPVRVLHQVAQSTTTFSGDRASRRSISPAPFIMAIHLPRQRRPGIFRRLSTNKVGTRESSFPQRRPLTGDKASDKNQAENEKKKKKRHRNVGKERRHRKAQRRMDLKTRIGGRAGVDMEENGMAL